jgi:putative ABC transport system permease protein
MDRLLQDLRVALRALRRQPSFTLVAMVTLALGVGATTAIFSVVYGILLRPLPFPEPDRLVHLGQTARSAPAEPVDGSISHVNFLDWQRLSRTVSPMALYTGGRVTVTQDGEADVLRSGLVTPDFFEVFQTALVMGRTFTADENRASGPRAIIIGYSLWQERFGGRSDVIGQTVEISGAPWPIVGVAPRGFDFPRDARLWLPVRNNDEQCGRGCVYLNGVGRLSAGASLDAAQQEMASIAAALERDFPAANTDVTVQVQSLRDRTVGSVQLALIVLLASVMMVLLIACANVANLVLVRGAARANEIAVRSALGAGRRGVLSYLLTEHLVLAAAGGVLGLVVAAWGIDVLRAVAPENLPRLGDIRFDLPTFAFALLMAALTTVLFGLGPSWHMAAAPQAQSLGLRGAGGDSGRRWTRSALLVAEVTLSVVLLLGAGLLFRSLTALQRIDPGFRVDGLSVLTLSLPPARYPAAQVTATHERLDAAIAAVPGVTRVARISGLPLGPSENVLNFRRLDQPPPPVGRDPVALFRVADAEYFQTLRIPVIAGRLFDETDRDGAPRAVIISQRMADVFWSGEDAVGRPIQISGQDPARVVGIVANVRSQTLAQAAQPEMYVAHAQTPVRTITYVVESSLASGQILGAVRDVVRRVDSRLPLIDPGAMSDMVDDQLARPRFYVVLLGLFAVLAIVLAAVGVYGVVAYSVVQRTREIGLRMALGANRGSVVRLMIGQGLRPALAGVAIGSLAAAAAGRVIRGLLYDVQPHDLVTFAAVAGLVTVVVVVASAIPAQRASGVAPAEALRGE